MIAYNELGKVIIDGYSEIGKLYLNDYDLIGESGCYAYVSPTDYTQWKHCTKVKVSTPESGERVGTVTITYDSEMNTDFSDIRFSTLGGINVPYSLKAKTDSTTAVFNVWLPSDDTRVFLYYGNPSAESESSESDVYNDSPMFNLSFDNLTLANTGTSTATVYQENTGVAKSRFDLTTNDARSFSQGVCYVKPFGTGATALRGLSEFTYSMWVRYSSSATNSYADLIYSINGGGSTDVLRIDASNNSLMLIEGGTTIDTSDANVLIDDTWHLVELTHDGTTSKVYVDGTEVISASATWDNVGTSIAYGGNGSTSTNTFYGRLDDIKIYNYVIRATESTLSVMTKDFNPYYLGYTWNAFKWVKAVDVTDVPTVDAQVDITVDYVAGMSSTSLNDVRFATDDGVNIEYWRKSVSVGTSADFVILLPANTSRIKVYYGNSSANYTGDIDMVSEIGDDWRNQSSLNTELWTVETNGATSSVSVLNNISFTCDSAASGVSAIISKQMFHDGYSFECSFKSGDVGNRASKYSVMGFGADEARYLNSIVEGTQAVIFEDASSSDAKWYARSYKSGVELSSIEDDISTSYKTFKIVRTGTELIHYIDGTEVARNTRGLENEIPIVIGIDALTTSSGASYTDYAEWVIVRKYLATEPTFTFNPVGYNIGYYLYDWSNFEHQATIIVEDIPTKHTPTKFTFVKADHTVNTDLSDLRCCDVDGNYLPTYVEINDTTVTAWTITPVNATRFFMRSGYNNATSENDVTIRDVWNDEFDSQSYTSDEWTWETEPTTWDVNSTYSGSLYWSFPSTDLEPVLIRSFGGAVDRYLNRLNAHISFNTNGTDTFTANYNRIVYRIRHDANNYIEVGLQRSYGTREIKIVESIAGTRTQILSTISWTTSTSLDDPQFYITAEDGSLEVLYKRGTGDSSWLTAISGFSLNKSTYKDDMWTEYLGGGTSGSMEIYYSRLTVDDSVVYPTLYPLPEGYSPDYIVPESALSTIPKRCTLTVGNNHTARYPKKITVTHDGDNMAANFSDLWFTDELRRRCTHWIESYESGVSAEVWVLVPVAGNIYMYYGDVTVEDVSNGNSLFNAFVYGEQPEHTGYQEVGDPNIFTSSEGENYISIYNTASIEYIWNVLPRMEVLKFHSKLAWADTGYSHIRFTKGEFADGNMVSYIGAASALSGFRTADNTGYVTSANTPASDGDLCQWVVIDNVIDSVNGTQKYYQDGTLYNSVSTYSADEYIDHYYIGRTELGTNTAIRIHWMCIYEPTETEPTISIGAEEANPLYSGGFVQKLFTSVSDIGLLEVDEFNSDMLLQKGMILLSDTLLKSEKTSVNDVLLQTYLTMDSDILLQRHETIQNDVLMFKDSTYYYDILMRSTGSYINDTLLSGDYQFGSDLLVMKDVEYANNLLIQIDFEFLNSVLLYTQKNVTFRNDVLLQSNKTIKSDVLLNVINAMVSDIMLAVESSSVNDVLLVKGPAFFNDVVVQKITNMISDVLVKQDITGLSDIILHTEFTFVNNVLTVDVKGLLAFTSMTEFTLDMYSEHDRTVRFSSSVEIDII